MEVADRLKIVMEYYELTPSSFADRLNVQRSSISHLLSGRNNPSLDFVMKVLDAFPEVDLYWLVNGIGEFPLNENKSQEKSNTQFSATSNIEQQKLEFPIDTKLTQHTPEETFSSLSNNNQDVIEQIVIFYKDGLFKNFTPKK